MTKKEIFIECGELKTDVDGNAVGVVASTATRVVSKILDVNKYATKKTIAQGLLDVALLTTNANHLKYILRVGEKHEFYTLMLTLISISIILQLIVAILFVIIGGLNINKIRDHRAALVLNDIILIFIFLISVVNIIISGFGFEYSNQPLTLISDIDPNRKS
ncbi:ninjurin-2-like isoform X4 [Rhynchophorus ferrugineus]|uniref:ninjurin-2-like isoform X4 n=1 Tax=Rhynchophorus ferrugineus TaxID=354439 RepID=UPI003FCDCBD1